jgi:hypothetical protein
MLHASCVPRLPASGIAAPPLHADPAGSHAGCILPAPRREPALSRDAFVALRLGETHHIISENYAYKTDAYYTILQHELEGLAVKPASRDVLDISVVPLCLERARLQGIPVCDWGISQGYVPVPSILYGINYFASTAAYCVVMDNTQAKEAVRHLTNCGKYPFCYQKLPPGATISSRAAVFGRTSRAPAAAVEEIARQVYELFAIPLVTMVFVDDGETVRLSSLAPTRYSRLSNEERSLLAAYLNHQVFL